jgi:hypothetical protein
MKADACDAEYKVRKMVIVNFMVTMLKYLSDGLNHQGCLLLYQKLLKFHSLIVERFHRDIALRRSCFRIGRSNVHPLIGEAGRHCAFNTYAAVVQIDLDFWLEGIVESICSLFQAARYGIKDFLG